MLFIHQRTFCFGLFFSFIMLNINIKAAAARAVFMVISRELRNTVNQQLHVAAGHEHGKQTNEFAMHEQLCAAAAQSIPSLTRT
jgi:hypothetical protein